MTQEFFWQELKNRFNVDLGETILSDNCSDKDVVSVQWRVVESKTFGHSKVEFRRVSDGKLHMPGAAAVVYENGDQLFYQNGFLHNLNGPAKILHFSGQVYCEYYAYGMLTGTSGNCIGPNPKQLASIPHLPGEPVADPKNACWN